MAINKEYIDAIRERAKKSKVYRQFQETGLMLAEILTDERHKALYMRLAKKYDNQRLLSLAKDIAGNKNVKNKGAYFMRVLFDGFAEAKAEAEKKKKGHA